MAEWEGGQALETIIKEDLEKSDSVILNTGETPAVADASGYLICKRISDLVFAVVGLAVCLIPMLVIGILVKLDSKGPAIFKQERLGQNGKVFTIYKFRTMRVSAPKDVAAVLFTESDRYITRVGAFLRRTGIDELPQLWNILRGDMSFIGYRPLCLTEREINEERARLGVLSVRPGITGWAQVNGRNNISDEEKARLDAEYVCRLSLKLDLVCLLKTVTTILSSEGG